MANEKTPARKGVQVHATIDAELFDALEDHRWNVRKNMVDVVKTALTEYAERNGITTTKTDAGKEVAAPKP